MRIRRTAQVVIQPLSLPEMYVVAAILESGGSCLDGRSIARDALARCALLISTTAVYTTLDRLERKHLVTWDHAGGEQTIAVRTHRRYSVTIDGREAFSRSLVFMPIEDRRGFSRRASMLLDNSQG
jgi:DNA-binding PadR family transcriptional regulator